MLPALRAAGRWSPRRWIVAALAAAAYLLVVAVPTDLIDTPWFTRDVPPTWWAWPSLILSAVLIGMLTATYVSERGRGTSTPDADRLEPGGTRSRRFGMTGSVLTFFAVGCPVCNKIVLLALGYAGALTWFEPLQPVLQAVAIVLLGWALAARLRGAISCPVQQPNSIPTIREQK